MSVFFANDIAGAAAAPCEECQDLCRLMDQYQQRVKAVELWSQYTGNGGKSIPAQARTGNDMQNLFKAQFDEWLERRVPSSDASGDDLGSLPCRLKRGGGGGGGGAVPVLQVNIGSCKILTDQGEELAGPELEAFEESLNCKADSDAVIAHEKVHQMHCLNAKAADPTGYVDFLDTPWMTVESERDAYARHRDELRDAINRIVSQKGCGWDQSFRLKQDPAAIPTLEELQEMSKRAWEYSSALSDGAVSPPAYGALSGGTP